MKHVHFIGIGGTGLSAIAQVLLESGIEVSGSDRQASPLSKRIQAAGAQVYAGHSPENILGADLVVRSSAIPDQNVEVQAAVAAGIPVLKRADFLRLFLGASPGRKVLAISGTHGKTTTTAMVAWMLKAMGFDPSYIIGSVSTNLGTNAHAGHDPYFVIEADEYDHMFLGLHPFLAVATNIEHDHPDCYPDPEDYYRAFFEFTAAIPPAGALLACGDDAGAVRLIHAARTRGQRVFSYGLSNPDCTYRAQDLKPNKQGGYTFDVIRQSAPVLGTQDNPGAITALATVALRVPGAHNVCNALAALAVADLLGLAVAAAASALQEYCGTGRRFEERGTVAGVTVIDDYAHHPTEIRATLAAARARYPERPLWAVWQPHTFSRTRTLFNEFCSAFAAADNVLVTEIYAAREAKPADGFSARLLVEAMSAEKKDGSRQPAVHFTPELSQAKDYLLAHVQRGDVVLVLSAGDADQVSTQFLQQLAEAA